MTRSLASGVLPTQYFRMRRSAAAAAGDSPIEFVYRYDRLPDSIGTVGIQVTVQLPSSITDFAFSLDHGASLEETTGFEKADGEHDFRWTQTTRSPVFSYTADVNRHGQELGKLISVDTDSWALIDLNNPGFQFHYRWRGSDSDPGWIRSDKLPKSRGYAGYDLVFLGSPVEVTTQTIGGGQTLRVILPQVTKRSGLDNSPGDIVATIAAAADELDVGARDREINLFLVTDPLAGGYTISNAGAAGRNRPDDIWMNESRPLDVPNNLWIHEYVHTRQEFRTTSETRWLIEGIAEYYGALLSWKQGHISEADARNYLQTQDDSDANLTDPSSWTGGNAAYTKGRRVVAALDGQIRRVTGGNANFQTVFRRLNARSGKLSYGDFKGLLATVADSDVVAWLDKYVASSDVPDIPKDMLASQGG
ncbi:MAG: hypothetical protein ABEJ28_09435 [Salinigranum sp.]